MSASLHTTPLSIQTLNCDIQALWWICQAPPHERSDAAVADLVVVHEQGIWHSHHGLAGVQRLKQRAGALAQQGRATQHNLITSQNVCCHSAKRNHGCRGLLQHGLPCCPANVQSSQHQRQCSALQQLAREEQSGNLHTRLTAWLMTKAARAMWPASPGAKSNHSTCTCADRSGSRGELMSPAEAC